MLKKEIIRGYHSLTLSLSRCINLDCVLVRKHRTKAVLNFDIQLESRSL